MSPIAALQTLRQQLTNLYDDSASLRGLVDDVGLATERIAFGGAIAEIWQNVLREAHRQDRVEAIVAYASAAYPARAAVLAVAYQPYRQAVAAALPVSPATAPAPPAQAESDQLRRTLSMAQRTLTILEEQAAGYTALSTPAHLRIELEEKRSEVARLEAQLKGLGG